LTNAETIATGNPRQLLLQSIHAAAGDIEGKIVRTPLVRLPWLDTDRRRVWAKLECAQLTGSFKIRGALTALSRLRNVRRVISASAGNHGIAIATAAKHFGVLAKVYVPTTASDVKVSRLIAAGAEIVPFGRDLFEAIQQARRLEQRNAGVFISPYEHFDVVAGQGTLALEVHDQFADGFDHALVPFGGGGLLTGFAAAAKQCWPRIQIHAVCPAVFGRDFGAAYRATEMKRPVVPTLADGLAVRHDSNSWLSSLLPDLIDSFQHVDEDAIKAAVFALLARESILAEGAGAIGVAPLLTGDRLASLTGDILIIVSGGNFSVSNLAKVLTFPYADRELRTFLGLRANALISEIDTISTSDTRPAPASPDYERPHDQELSPLWRNLVATISESVELTQSRVADHRDYVAREELDEDPFALGFVETSLGNARDLAASCSDPALSASALARRCRLLIQQHAFAARALRWCSASCDHSREIMFFDPLEVQSTAVNYDRYGSPDLQNLEEALQATIGFGEQQTLLLTSSGQAAYTTIESFLLREVLTRHPDLAVMPYIYFEAMEQIESLPFVRVHRCTDWSETGLRDLVESTGSSVAFLDPLANNMSMNQVDLRVLAEALRSRDWSKRWLVIDGTMVSGALNPFEIFDQPHHPRILYYESASKYGQLGLDLQMAGLVVADRTLAARLNRHRRNCGTLMYPNQVPLFPRVTRPDFLSRMRRLTDNAEMLVAAIRGIPELEGRVSVAYPDRWRDLGWAHGGGVVAVDFSETGLNNRPSLDALMELMIHGCREASMPMTKGVSFGFGTTRVSAAAAIAGETDPFLRFSVGEETRSQFSRLVGVICGAFREFMEQGSR
jgi:threonine dehydratase/cystathionine beta-lyase/cystathionine gamma-synthase